MATIRSLAGLNDSNFSKLLKEKRSKQGSQVKKIRSLLAVVEHYLISWEKEDCCLLIKNLLDVDSSRGDQKKYEGSKSTSDHFLVCCFAKLSVKYIPCILNLLFKNSETFFD